MKKGIIGVAVAAALALSAGTASAFSVGTIVQSSGIGGNNGVQSIYGVTTPVSGFFGANWALVGGSADIRVEFLGREAGWNNTFTFGGPTLANASFSNDSFSTSPPSGGSYIASGVGPGLLIFSFTTGRPVIDGGPVTVANGSNPDNTTSPNTVNFFSRIVDCGLTTACYGGQALDLWLDDLGGGPDDNHDDMVIRLSIVGGDGGFQNPVPIPAAFPLLLSGLAGLGLIGRRRRVVPV